MFFRKIPIDVRDQFKAWCMQRGIFMTHALIVFMEECLKNPNLMTKIMIRNAVNKKKSFSETMYDDEELE